MRARAICSVHLRSRASHLQLLQGAAELLKWTKAAGKTAETREDAAQDCNDSHRAQSAAVTAATQFENDTEWYCCQADGN